MAPDERGLVVVVEDEANIAEILSLYLTREGFDVQTASDGISGLAMIESLHPVAALLDVGLPGIDGTEICRQLRSRNNQTPVLFCTARDDEIDRVLGLEMGADDYITKPFSPREVVARVKAVLRRQSASSGLNSSQASEKIEFGHVVVDPVTRRCFVDGQDIPLTATEFDLAYYLVAQPNTVFSRDQLMVEVWGYSSAVGSRTVDVHIAQLRAKLGEPDIIRTVRGVGYSAEVPS